MPTNKIIPFFIFFFFIQIPFVRADSEAGNWFYVRSSEYGRYYAKTIPDETYGTKGKTYVYKVMKEDDELVFTYNWYSPEFYISDYIGAPIVQFGPWTRGHDPSADHLAIAFHNNGELLKKYSTLDIAKDVSNINRSISHYTVFKKRLGFRSIHPEIFLYEVEDKHGNVLSFNIMTGELMTPEKISYEEMLSDYRMKIMSLKSRWWFKHKDSLEDANLHEITVEELKEFAPQNFPEIPEGHTLIPGALWQGVKIEKITK